VRAVSDGMSRAKTGHNASAAVQSGDDIPFEYGLILCAMRSFNEDMGPYYAQLLRSLTYTPRKRVFAAASLELARAAARLVRDRGLPVVAFDLAGEESGYPAIDHREAYEYAHRNFLKKTVHAGEAYGPESIFQAITECHTNRIGHGTFLFAADMVRDPDIEDPLAYTRSLAEYIASQRMTIEVCPTSNLQTTPEIRSMAEHPVLKMIDYGMSVTICTDNRLVSNTTVSRELELVADKLPITRQHFRNLVVAGFKGSFFPGSYRSKRAFVRRVIDRYERLERDLLGE
jgi:adenosine deaminase